MRIMAVLLLVLLLPCGTFSQSPPAQEPSVSLAQSLKKAQVGGKYRMLLRQTRVPEDAKEIGNFSDFGFLNEPTYAGNTGLPRGYWVYSAPYWYIWRDQVTGNEIRRPWGAEQATGKPDTPEAGDYQTAWASSTPDESDEWLMLEYKTPVLAAGVHIYETYNPGADVRITAFLLDGREVEVWSRPRPEIPPMDAQIFKVRLFRKVQTCRIKIYLASRAVPGWNEIDAVGLRDDEGGLQWATAAHASSTYGVAEERIDPRDERIRALEGEVNRLKAQLEAARRGQAPR